MGKVHVFDVYFFPSFLLSLFIEMCVRALWTECGKAARGSSLKLKNTESVKKLICRLNQRNFELSDFSFRHSWSGVGLFFRSLSLFSVLFIFRCAISLNVRQIRSGYSCNPNEKWKIVWERDVADPEKKRKYVKQVDACKSEHWKHYHLFQVPPALTPTDTYCRYNVNLLSALCHFSLSLDTHNLKNATHSIPFHSFTRYT